MDASNLVVLYICVYTPYIFVDFGQGETPQSTGEINYQNSYFRKVFTSLLCFETIKQSP